MTTNIHKARGLEKDFVMLHNKDVQRKDLSYEAVGMLVYLMSLPEDWTIHISTLHREKTGRDKVYRILHELETKGYLHIEQTKNEDGTFSSNEYAAYAMPEFNPHYTNQPLTENPFTDNPVTGNPPLQSKERKKENKKDSVRAARNGNSKSQKSNTGKTNNAPTQSPELDKQPAQPNTRNEWYDAIKSVWGYVNGRNGDMQKFLQGADNTRKGAQTTYKLPADSGLTPALLKMWAEDYHENSPELTIVAAPDKVQSDILAWLEQRAGGAEDNSDFHADFDAPLGLDGLDKNPYKE